MPLEAPANAQNRPEHSEGFFAAETANDKQFTIVPGAGHALHLEKPRARMQVEVLKWFSADQPGSELDLVSGTD